VRQTLIANGGHIDAKDLHVFDIATNGLDLGGGRSRCPTVVGEEVGGDVVLDEEVQKVLRKGNLLGQ